MDKHLHIVCLDVPYPVNYGGVFDLFYKLPALQNEGVKIHLHCFDYGRGEQPELDKYCESVSYYKRVEGIKSFSFRVPYIVGSRSNKELFKNLLKDDYPILMEGIHCTALLVDKRFANRKCFVRLHNVEHVYYRHLFQTSFSAFKKLYYWFESELLERYEKAICNKAEFWTVSIKDAESFRLFGCTRTSFLPLFLPPWKVSGLEGKGSFCLYHGDLSVAENQKAVSWLLKEVFSQIEIPLVIAGKEPPVWLIELAESNGNICVVANPTESEMQDMITKAHVNVIPSFNATGIKLKLINSLYNGRHCLVNAATVEGTGLEAACRVASDAHGFIAGLKDLITQPYTTEDRSLRSIMLSEMFNNEASAKFIVKSIFGDAS